MKLEIDWLRNNWERLYYFGLGFIQLKINETERLHFHTPELPAFNDDIHNHRYDFRSEILYGSLTAHYYQRREGVTWFLVNESCNPDIEAPADKILCSMQPHRTEVYNRGDHYELIHDVFHRVEANKCITYLQRSDYRKEYAQVAYPVVRGPLQCPFSQKIANDQLWDIIDRMCNESRNPT